MRRRHLLQIGGTALVGGLVGCRHAQGSTGTPVGSDIPPPPQFTAPLPVPAAARPVNGRVELNLRMGEAEIFPGHRTMVHGYEGTMPGPTIEAVRGQQLTIALRNSLPTPAVLHLHGGKTPPEHDGYPTDLVRPGAVREYVYPLQQRAASLWYHDHTMDMTAMNVYLGQLGMVVLRDPAEDALGLPSGVRDVPLIVCDRAFDRDHQMKYPTAVYRGQTPPPGGDHGGHGGHGGGTTDPAYAGGVLGDVMLVNGAPWPVMDVDAARYRFRILNGSNARRLELALDKGRMVQIGSDLGLLRAPVERSTLALAQAERADIVVDFSEVPVGQRVRMVNRIGDQAMGQVMEFVVARAATDDSRVPPQLSEYASPQASDASVTRDFHFALGPATARFPNGVWTVNGLTFDNPEPVATVRRGTVELWRFSSDVHHPVHVHLLEMHVLRHRGGPPGPAYAGIKDTVDLTPGDALEVLVPVQGFAGRYVMHCHNLEHEDMMMMANIDIV